MRKVLVILSLCAGFSYGGRYDLPSSGTSGTLSSFSSSSVLSTPISINTRSPVSLPELLSLISQVAKIPIVLRDISYPASIIQQTQTAGVGQAVAGTQTQTIAQSEYYTLKYFADGKPLSQVLDEITGTFDLWWKQEDGRIVVYKYESKSYQLTLPFLQKKIDEKSGALSLSYARDFMKNLEDSFKKLLYDPNSKVSVNEMGFVFVFARPSELKAVESAVRRINLSYTQEIPLKIKTYLVSEQDLMNLGINLSFKNNNLSGSLSAGVENPVFSLSLLTSKIEAQLTALASSGKAAVIEESLLRALNGQPIYYSPFTKTRIISKFNLSYVSSGSNAPPIPTVVVETEDLQSGSSLIIVPYYIDTDRIVVDLYRKQSDVQRIDYQTVDLSGFQNKVALPVLSERTNVNQTIMKRGDVLVLFSSAYTTEDLKKTGLPFLKDIPLLGYLFSNTQKEKDTWRLIITVGFDTKDNSEEK